MLSFKKVAARLRGISTPFGGVSWEAPEPERAVARRVLRFLEDRRVLFNPPHMEYLPDCVESVLAMREFLTTQVSSLETGPLSDSLLAMRAACRKFMNRVGHPSGRHGMPMWGYEGGELMAALGELRGVVGIHVAQLSVMYGIDLEDTLAEIIPDEPDAEA